VQLLAHVPGASSARHLDHERALADVFIRWEPVFIDDFERHQLSGGHRMGPLHREPIVAEAVGDERPGGLFVEGARLRLRRRVQVLLGSLRRFALAEPVELASRFSGRVPRWRGRRRWS
jgi:hypothetical protein